MKRMRRITAIALILSVFLSLAACAELNDDARETMREQAEALTALMAECTGDEAYVRLYLGSNGEAKALIDKIAKAAWNQYSEGTVYVLKEGAIEAFLSASGVSLKDFSPDVADKVRQSVGGSVPSAVASQAGAAFMAAVSVLRTGCVFQADEAFPECALVFLKYNRDYGVLCSFVKNDEDIVSASLIPAPADCEKTLKRVLGLRSLFARNNDYFEEYPLN